MVVVNPAAGKEEPVLSALSEVLGPADVDWDVRVTTGEGDASSYAAEAREEVADLVMAYGGDGTVSAVAAALEHSRIPLGILPGGTGNAVAQELGIPLDLRQALELAADPMSRIAPIDCLQAGDRRFLLRVGIGADARMISGADREEKNRLGWLAYLMSALRQITNPEQATYRVRVDDSEFEFEALTVILANIGRIGRGGLHFAEDIDCDDGLMDMVVIRDSEAGSVLSVGATLLGLNDPTSEHPWPPEDAPMFRMRARRVRVEARPEQEVHGDGELLATTPLEVQVNPAAIHVVLPPERDPDPGDDPID